jgi:hypothetical protein
VVGKAFGDKPEDFDALDNLDLRREAPPQRST